MPRPRPLRSAPCLLLVACSATGSTASEPDAKALVHRFVDAANAHDYEEVERLLAPDFVRRSQATPDVDVRSSGDMVDFLVADARTFPDGRVSIEDLVVEGDRVAFLGRYTGTQEGPLGPYPASNRTVDLDVSGAFRVEGARIVELRIVWDNRAALRQLGHWPPPDDPSTLRAANEALARVWFEEVINRRNLDAIDQHYAEDYVHHGLDGTVIRGRDEARALASAILAASSDRFAIVEEQIAEDDLVATRFVSRGTQDGPFQGRAASGEEWVTHGICISRIEGGKIAEDWELVHHGGR